jgi:hypothetical protein
MNTEIFATRREMGIAAANAAADFLRQTLREQETVRAIFAAAPSQNEMLAALREADGIDWNRVVAFHMDEYIGLAAAAPQRRYRKKFYCFMERSRRQGTGYTPNMDPLRKRHRPSVVGTDNGCVKVLLATFCPQRGRTR